MALEAGFGFEELEQPTQLYRRALKCLQECHSLENSVVQLVHFANLPVSYYLLAAENIYCTIVEVVALPWAADSSERRTSLREVCHENLEGFPCQGERCRTGAAEELERCIEIRYRQVLVEAGGESAAGRMETKQVEDPQNGVQNETDPSVAVAAVVAHTYYVVVASYAVAVGANIGSCLEGYYEEGEEEGCLGRLP